MAGCIRIVKFSLHLFGFVLLCGVALKLFRMSVNMKDTLSALLIMFSFLLVMLIFADRMTGCFTSVYINGVARQMDVIQSWSISICGMLSILLAFRKRRWSTKRHLRQQNAFLLQFDDGPRRKGKSLAELNPD